MPVSTDVALSAALLPEDAVIAETGRLHSKRRRALIKADPAFDKRGGWRALLLMAEYRLTVENTQSYMQPLREELQAFWQSAIDRSFGAANQVRIQWQAMSRQDRAEFLQMP